MDGQKGTERRNSMDEKNKKGAKTTHNACVAYRPSDRFARISVYKRDVHINSLYTYVHTYIYLCFPLCNVETNWSPSEIQREREKEIVISSRLGCRDRVALQLEIFLVTSRFELKGRKTQRGVTVEKLQLRDTRRVGGDSGLQVKRAG